MDKANETTENQNWGQDQGKVYVSTVKRSQTWTCWTSQKTSRYTKTEAPIFGLLNVTNSERRVVGRYSAPKHRFKPLEERRNAVVSGTIQFNV